MRVVVTGATGNVGTSVLSAVSADPNVDEVTAVARRTPPTLPPGTRFVAADIRESDLEAVFAGADAVIHLAWLIQPGRDEAETRSTNVDGSLRVLRATAAAGVKALIYASSVGTYAPGPKDRAVDESWPATGVPTSFYSRHKARVEAELDRFEREHSGVRVVRVRPGLIFKREAATEIRRLFLGPLVPGSLMRAAVVPIFPVVPGLGFQVVHSDDVADAYRRALLSDAVGAFNVATEPAIGPGELSALLGARPVSVPYRALRAVARLSFAAHLQPVEPGWLDLGVGVPTMDCSRVRRELGWTPVRDARSVLLELAEGLRAGAAGATPPLSAAASGTARWREFATGLGSRP